MTNKLFGVIISSEKRKIMSETKNSQAKLNYSPEEIFALAKPELKMAVAKLITNQVLSADELTQIASHNNEQIATVAMHITNENIRGLGDPYAIIGTLAAFNSNLGTKQSLENYQKNMMLIHKMRQIKEEKQQEKGTTR